MPSGIKEAISFLCSMVRITHKYADGVQDTVGKDASPVNCPHDASLGIQGRSLVGSVGLAVSCESWEATRLQLAKLGMLRRPLLSEEAGARAVDGCG